MELTHSHPYTHLISVSEPLGVSKRLIVNKQLKEYKPKEDKHKKDKPKKHKQLPKRL